MMEKTAMEMTEEQKQQVKEKFSSRRNKQLLVSLPMILLIFGFVFLEKPLRRGELGVSYDSAGIAFFIIVIIALVFSFRNWRCPACNTYLGKNINPKFCAKCGAELR